MLWYYMKLYCIILYYSILYYMYIYIYIFICIYVHDDRGCAPIFPMQLAICPMVPQGPSADPGGPGPGAKGCNPAACWNCKGPAKAGGLGEGGHGETMVKTLWLVGGESMDNLWIIYGFTFHIPFHITFHITCPTKILYRCPSISG